MWVGSFDYGAAASAGGGVGVIGKEAVTRRRSKERWMRRRPVRESSRSASGAMDSARAGALLRHSQSEAVLPWGVTEAATEQGGQATQQAEEAGAAASVAKRQKYMAGVVGHRGLGVNDGKNLATHEVRENTLRSFREAMAQGVTWFETDVQVTADGVPVIFHDDYLLFANPSSGALMCRTVRQLTFAEFKELRGDVIYRKFKLDGPEGAPRPWTCADDADSMPSLSELLMGLPPQVGINLELKLPDDDRHPDFAEEHRKFLVDQTLAVLDAAALATGSRRSIVFSSFDPDAAVYTLKAQNHHPVFFLTEAGNHTHVNPDPRRLSLQAAVQHALAHGLHGVVSHASAVLKDLSVARSIRESGLELATYGTPNSLPGSVAMQLLAGVSSVITDSARQSIAEELTWQMSQGQQESIVVPAPNADKETPVKHMKGSKSLPAFGKKCITDVEEAGYSSSDESIGEPGEEEESLAYESDGLLFPSRFQPAF